YKYLLKPDETYTLVASDIGLGVVETILTDSAWNGKKAFDLILKPAVTAQGIVTKPNDSVASNIRMELINEEDSTLIISKTDQFGFYQFVLDTNMKFKIIGINGEQKGFEIVETDESYNTNDSTNIKLKAPVAFVKGTIRHEDKTSAADVIVKIFDENGDLVAEATTDENGNYKFEVEKNANYQIIAETEGFSGLENIFTGDNWDNSNSLDIILKPTGNANYAYVTESESNKPLEKVKITLINLSNEKKIVIYSDKNGRFDFNLSPNSDYTLKFEKDNYFPKSIDIPTGKIVPNTTNLDLKIDLIMDYAGFIVKPIYFDYAKSKITDDSKQDLEQVLTTLKNNPKATILIKSFADCRGGSSYNLALSAERSSAVQQYLMSKGIAEKRVTTKSLGATNFANNCYKPELCTEKEHAANRRSEFEVDFHRE
ncbi:MAG: OmpA family protein, partial [Flavobacteriales bacterium]|nr:OmpA family protein [Flavobacteriales bacterium]